MIKLIGLCGKANIGKDYVATILKSYGWHPISFATHLKMDIVGKNEATYDEVMKTKPQHIRTVLQLKGTEFGRNVYGQDVWVNTLDAWLTYFKDEWGITSFVIPDVRFKNEAEYIRSKNGLVLKITSNDRLTKTALTSDQQQHESETNLDNLPVSYFDGIIINNLDTRTSELVTQLNNIIGR